MPNIKLSPRATTKSHPRDAVELIEKIVFQGSVVPNIAKDVRNMDLQIDRNAQTRGVRNTLPKSHPRVTRRKAEKRTHPQSPSDEKHNH